MKNFVNRRAFLGAALSTGALLTLQPSQAFAVTAAQKQSEVRAAKARLDAMAGEVSAAGDQYHRAMDSYDSATRKVEECQATIDEMTGKIATLQGRLETRATSMYRQGSSSYLDVLLGVRSFDDFATVWDRLNALNEDDADLVASTKVAKNTLESARSELIQQQEVAAAELSSAEAYMSQVLSKQAEYDRMYNNLSSEYQQILAEQEAAEARASANATQSNPPAPSQPSNSGGSSGGSSGGGSVVPAPSIPTHGSVVDYAYSRLGCDYVWGASGPNAFDCSGLVVWCYAKIGIYLPHYTESLYAVASARFSPTEAQPGDVLYKEGHVGISTGGLNCVEAMGTRWGVVESCRGGWTAALRF